MKKTYPYQIVQNQNYTDVLELQNKLREQVLNGDSEGEVLMVEHRPCITFGRSEKGGNLKQSFAWLEQHGFELAQINRGGKITYHGPGQLVMYPIVPVKIVSSGVKCYVHDLEAVMLEICKFWGVLAQRKSGFPGVWRNDQEKIGSVGIHVRKMVSIHGFSLNINPDLSHFDVMLPCGLDGVSMTSLAKVTGQQIPFAEVFNQAKSAFEAVFSCKLALRQGNT